MADLLKVEELENGEYGQIGVEPPRDLETVSRAPEEELVHSRAG